MLSDMHIKTTATFKISFFLFPPSLNFRKLNISRIIQSEVWYALRIHFETVVKATLCNSTMSAASSPTRSTQDAAFSSSKSPELKERSYGACIDDFLLISFYNCLAYRNNSYCSYELNDR